MNSSDFEIYSTNLITNIIFGTVSTGKYLVSHKKGRSILEMLFQLMVSPFKGNKNIIPMRFRKESEFFTGMDYIYIHPLK